MEGTRSCSQASGTHSRDRPSRAHGAPQETLRRTPAPRPSRPLCGQCPGAAQSPKSKAESSAGALLRPHLTGPRPSGRPGRVPPRDLEPPNLRARARGWARSLAAAPGSRTGPGRPRGSDLHRAAARPAPKRVAGPLPRFAARQGTRDPVSAAPRPRRTLTVQVSARRRARSKRDTAATPDMSTSGAVGRSSADRACARRHARGLTSLRPGLTSPRPGVLRRRARGLTSPRSGVLRRRALGAGESGQRRACAEGLAGGGAQGTWSASSRLEVSFRFGVFSGSPDFSLYLDNVGFFWRLRQFCEAVPVCPSRFLSGTEREFRYRAV